MKKYKIDNYIVKANSPLEAVKAVQLMKDSLKDEETMEEKIRKAQEWVDFDIKHHGEVSELTKRDIEKMGLKFDKWSNQVHDSKVKDEAFDRSTIEALIADEQAATDAYNVAIANLEGKISEESIKVLQAIRDDELRHSENLNAILAGNVTEKNLEDSVNDADPKQTVATIVAMLDDAKSAIQSEQYQRCGNLCFNIIQKLKATGLAK